VPVGRSESTVDLVRSAVPRLSAFWDGGSMSHELGMRGSLTIGRSSSCDVQIEHPSVSRHHAILHLGPICRIEDTGSANGTRVAGRPVASGMPVSIAPGEIIEIGNVVIVLQGGDHAAAERLPPRSTRPSRPVASSSTLSPPGARANETPMQRLERLLKLVSAGNVHVLVTGEPGVGKEVISARIHRSSRRAAFPFQCVGVTASTPALLEIELFGDGDKPGLIEAASGGTLVLDEVAELPLQVQARLLRVLERSETTRLNTTKAIPVDVRFIATTNQNLAQCVAEGTFREDLFFRLNGITIDVPPLRDRPEQIERIAQELLAEACVTGRREPMVMGREVLARLQSHSWPGNVREMKNAIERAVLLSPTSVLEPQSLPAGNGPSSSPTGTRLRSGLAAFERQRIVEALDKCAGNQTKAAQVLGISRRTLVSRLSEYNLPRPRGGGQRPSQP
jgi:DNA-binding NtrC family response regulator